MVLADPKGSVLAQLRDDRRDGARRAPGWSRASARISCRPNCDLSLVREAFTITDAESFATARELLRKEGILAGSSSGTLLAAALRYCRAQSDAQAGRDLRLRQRQQVPLQDVQRLLDARPGPARPRPRRAICATSSPGATPTGRRSPSRPTTPADRLSAHEALRHLPAAGAGRRQGRRASSTNPTCCWPSMASPEHFREPVSSAMNDRLEVIEADRAAGRPAADLREETMSPSSSRAASSSASSPASTC